MYWKEEREEEIEELKQQIKDATFKNDKKIPLKLKEPRPPESHPKFIENSISLDRFLYLIAEKVWKHIQHTKKVQEKIESLELSAQLEIADRLKKVRKYLEGTQWFNKKAINAAVKPLKEHLENKVKRAKKSSWIVKHEIQLNPKSDSWIERENHLIYEIWQLYLEYIPNQRTERQIVYFVSLVFKACNLWSHLKNYEETMKKRFQKILQNIKIYSETTYY